VVSGVLCADDLVYKDEAGRTRIRPYPVPAELRNEWPKEWEDAFWDRGSRAIGILGKEGGYGGTYFENEKAAYPKAMMGYFAGFRKPALDMLQAEDADAKAWNTVTDGIDFFPCFTLKGQMRKYFLFGPSLDPAYRERMKRAAKTWTEKDPLRRPHPFWKGEKQGWTPATMNSWVDVRNTDNLQSMRETSVYLMAEETGNEAVRQLYEDRLRAFVTNLYTVGMGEWDSENYHAHTFTAWLNLYDFAKKREVQSLAKAALDAMSVHAAVKYYRGAFNGPTKRDYNNYYRFGGAADAFAFYFGDFGEPPESYHYDTAHILSSAYRPPVAVVELARKNFARPCEIFAAHAHYDALRQGAAQPEEFETTYFGKTFQLGTLDRGTGRGDVNGFKLLAHNGKRGAEYFIANATTSPGNMGSPQYGSSQVGRMNVGQYRNLAIVLNEPGDSPFLFLAPKSATLTEERGVTFLKYERTWLAIQPVNLNSPAEDAALTAQLSSKRKELSADRILSSKGKGGAKFCGFALEVGEEGTDGDFDAFRANVLGKAKLDVGALAAGEVGYTGSNGATVKLAFGDRPTVWRNGTQHDWTTHWALYQGADGAESPVSLGWKQGALRVAAGGKTFACSVTPEGAMHDANP
jgi:hypothetical protein